MTPKRKFDVTIHDCEYFENSKLNERNKTEQ